MMAIKEMCSIIAILNELNEIKKILNDSLCFAIKRMELLTTS